MSEHKIKPLTAAVGAAFMVSVALSPMASAASNPFQLSELSSGYEVASKDAEGKCGEGKCGEGKAKAKAEGKCGEGKCGENKAKAKAEAEGKCGEGKAKAEGKCGEGKCGGKS